MTFQTIFKKELTESFFSLKMWLALLLCVALIPLSVYVSLQNYRMNLSDYQQLTKINEQQMRDFHGESPEFQAEGYVAPSPLSVFAGDLEWILPNKVLTHRLTGPQYRQTRGMSNEESFLFGGADVVFIFSYIITLLAIVFSYDIFSGEKELGTLRQIHANSLSRSTILVGKLAGNFLAFLIPVFVGLVIGLLLLNFKQSGAALLHEYWRQLGWMLLFILVFCAVFFLLGSMLSASFGRSLTAILSLILLWVVLVLALPGLSPMLAQVIYPVRPPQVMNLEKRVIIDNYNEKKLDRQDELKEQVFSNGQVNSYSWIKPGMDITDDFVKHWLSFLRMENTQENLERLKRNFTEYQTYLIKNQDLEAEINAGMNRELTALEREYNRKRRNQLIIARSISRISPVGCFTNVMTELADTGVLRWQHLMDDAGRFQREFEETYYQKIHRVTTGHGGWNTTAEEIDYDHLPKFQSTERAFSGILGYAWPDMLLLVIYGVLCFSGAYVAFLRYDVR